MKLTITRPIRPMEQLFLRAEQWPWQGLYRLALGFLFLPLFIRWYGVDGPAWALDLLFLGILFSLRSLPAILRRLLPFSREAQSEWAKQRMLAKRYDSYQWRKLFWIGLGLAIYIVFSGQLRSGPVVLAATCLVGGGLGLVAWRRVINELTSKST